MKQAFVACALVVASTVSGIAHAHTRLIDPMPRSTADGLKTGPCGLVASGAPKKMYTAGSTVQIKFEETIGHTGCFQVAYAANDGSAFTVLTQLNDPNDGIGARQTTVTLPNTPCAKCTLQLRQLMVGTCPANANPANYGATDTYYSCADVTLVGPDAGVPDGGANLDGGSSGGTDASSGGSTSSSGGGGSSGNGSSGSGDDAGPSTSRASSSNGDQGNFDDGSGGCNTSSGAPSGFLLGGLAIVGLIRASRKRKN